MVKKIEKELRSRFGNSLVLVSEDGFWKRYDAEYKELSVTVLIAECNTHNNGGWSYTAACAAANLWKRINHSGHMPYIDHHIDDSSKTVFVISEQLIPLSSIYRSYCPSELLGVIYSVSSAALHLHEQHQLSHNCITLTSLFVVPSQRRRCVLIDLQYCTPMNDAVGIMLAKTKNFRPSLGIPEDDQRAEVAYGGSQIWCRDSFGIGKVLSSFLQSKDGAMGHLSAWCSEALSDTMQAFSRQSADCLAAGFITEHAKISPPNRPSVASLITLKIFKSCATVAIQQGLDTLSMVGTPSPGFYSSLYSLLTAVPYYVIEETVMPVFLSRVFWLPPDSVVFTSRLLLATSEGCLLAKDRQKIVKFLVTSLESDRLMRTPVFRTLDTLLQLLSADIVTRSVFPSLLETIRSPKDHESLYWGIHGLIVTFKWISHEAVTHQEQAIEILNNKIIPLLAQTCLSSESSVRARSTSLLGLAQLTCLDGRFDYQGLLRSLTGCLLSGVDSLCHHSLNAVIMAETSLPLSALCCNILPVLSVVMLSNNAKLREKCIKVTELVLQSLEGVDDDDELEDYTSPPLSKGSPLVIECLKKEAKRQQKGPPLRGEEGDDVAATSTREKECELQMDDVELNEAKNLLVSGHVERDMRTLSEMLKSDGGSAPTSTRHFTHSPGGPKEKITSRKKKGTRKTKLNNPSPKEAQLLCPEDSALAIWEKRTYDDEGEPYSTSLASTLRLNELTNGSVEPSGGESDSLFAGTTLHTNGQSGLSAAVAETVKPERRKKKRVMTKKKAGTIANPSSGATAGTAASKPATPLGDQDRDEREASFSGLLLTEGLNVGSPTTNGSLSGFQSPLEVPSGKSLDFPKQSPVVELPNSLPAPKPPSGDSIDDLLDMYGGDELVPDVEIGPKGSFHVRPKQPSDTLVATVAEQQQQAELPKKTTKTKSKKKKPRGPPPINSADL